MTSEILLHDECLRLACRLGLPDLPAHARALHARAAADLAPWTPMNIVRAFGVLHAAEDDNDAIACVLFAFAGTGSWETDGYEGMQVTFELGEFAQAVALLAEASAGYGEQFIADDLAERIRCGSFLA